MQRRDLSLGVLGIAGATLLPRVASATCTPLCDDDVIIYAANHGLAAANSGSANATAIQAAITAAQGMPSGGGTVQLPAGNFTVDPFEIPEFVNVRGAGMRATVLTCNSPGYFINVGGSKNGNLKYGCSVSDLAIQMTDANGHAIRLMETCGAEVARCYMEGAIISGRSCRGITIDGGDRSSFFNHFRDVICNHWQTSYLLLSSGTTETTLNHFTNCTALGDVGGVGSASIGIRLSSGQGSGSVWVGGNFEACGYGVQLESGCQSMTFHGARFEGNTKDVYLQGTAGAASFIGCFMDFPYGVLNNASAGYDTHSFIGTVNGSNQGTGARLMGTNKLIGGMTSDLPLTVEAYPGHTTQIAMQVQNSAGTKLFAVNGLGQVDKQVYRSGASSPVGGVTPRFVGEEYLQTSGIIRWFKSHGLGPSDWVALN